MLAPVLVGFLALTTLATPAHESSPAAALESRLIERVSAAYDTAKGGFVSRRGRPSESAVELAFQLGAGSDDSWKPRAVATLVWTWALYDSVGGGFVEAKRDADPSEPMFAKLTLSNARRLENLLQAWEATSDPLYRDHAAAVADFFERTLKDGRGGFIAGQVGDRELVPDSDGAAIHAWLEWARVSRRRALLDFALLSLDRSWTVCWDDHYGMLRKGSFGEPLKLPQLADQVEMGRAYVLGSRLGGRAVDLARARTIGDHLLERYEDPEKGGFWTQAVPKSKGGFRHNGRDAADNARAARFLCELSVLTGDRKYREASRRAWESFEPKLDDPGLDAADWALAIRAASSHELPGAPTWAREVEAPYTPPRSFRMRVRK